MAFIPKMVGALRMISCNINEAYVGVSALLIFSLLHYIAQGSFNHLYTKYFNLQIFKILQLRWLYCMIK